MARSNPCYYIAPSAVSVTPNANDSASDLAVHVTKGTKIKVFSYGISGLGYNDTARQQWTLNGRNRRLSDPDKPYTIYARLQKDNKDYGYLIFAPKVADGDKWLDKYAYISIDGLATDTANKNVDDYWYVKLGDVSLPENGKRTVTLDTGILGTDQFNTEWNLHPDDMPLRVELSATIDLKDAGDKPYVPWGKELVLRAKLLQGWADTNVRRFHHWTIQRDTGNKDADLLWNFPYSTSDAKNPSSGRLVPNGNVALSHARGDGDVFNGTVSSLWTVTAWGTKADSEGTTSPDSSSASSSSSSSSSTTAATEEYEKLAEATINILAETAEQFSLELSSAVANYDPSSDTYNPREGIDVMIRAVDQKGEVFKLTNAQRKASSLAIQYCVAENPWNTCDFTGADTEVAKTNIPIEAFHSQQNVNVRIVRVIVTTSPASDSSSTSSSASTSQTTTTTYKELYRTHIPLVRNGEDSKEREWIFLRSKTALQFSSDGKDTSLPLIPSLIGGGEVKPEEAAAGDDTNKNQDGWVPESWWDEMRGTDSEYHYEYAAYRDYIKGGVPDSSSSSQSSSSSASSTGNASQRGGHWGEFSTPRIWGYYAEDAVTYRCRWTLAGVEVYQLKCAYTGAFRGTLPLVATLMKRVGSGQEQEVTGKTVITLKCEGIDYSKTFNTDNPTFAVNTTDKDTADFVQYLNKVELSGLSVSFTVDGEEHNFSIPVIREADEDSVKDTIDSYGNKKFLRKDQDDATPHKLGMGEAEVTGNATVGGDVSVNGSTGSNKITVGTYKAGVSGAVLQNTAKDGSYLEVDRMFVRAMATFNSLGIVKIQYSSGQRIVGKGGVVLTKVEDMKDGDGNIIAYKCYFNSKLDDRYYHNPFIVKDQAIAQSWDDDKNSGNHRYWRLVTEVGEDTAIGVGYIVLSNDSDKCEANSDAPRVDDEVCQLGYQGTDQPDRQSAIMESTIGDNAPYYTMFQHINSFSLASCDILTFGNKDGRGYIQVYGDAYVGDRNGDTTYIKYDSNKKQLVIKAKLTAMAGSDFTDSGMEKGEGNLIKNSGFTGDYSSAVIEDGATITSDTKIYSDPWGSWTTHTGCTINDDSNSASGKSCTLNSGTLTQTIAYPLLQGTYMLTLMHKNDEQLTITFGGATVIVNASANYKRENIKIEVTDTSATTFSITGSGTICELQLQAGNVSSAAWTPSHSDNSRYLGYYSALQYLLDAIANGSTQTLGGLVLTQMLKVGNYTNGAMAQETGGMNGEYNNDNSPFLWGGGTLEQAIATIAMYAEDPNFSPTDEQLKQMAKFVVTHGGRAILTDMIMRGYIYALGGVFKGDIRVDGTLTGGTLKGTTVEGLKGTFKELSALDSKGVTKASVYLSEDGRLTFDGDMYNQGRDSEENRSHRFYSGDIFCRGSFGHLLRFVALVTGSTMQVFPKGDDGTTAVTLHLESATASNGKTYYKVPLFVSATAFPGDFLDTSKDLRDVSGMPIDVVAFNVTAETYYLLTNFGCGKGVDVVNTNDDVNVYLCDNGGWNRLLGGASTHFFYLPPKFINNPPTTEGAGLFKLDNHDINW